MQLCELTNIINHGTVVQAILKDVETEKPVIVTGDHRQMWQFLADWDAAGRPMVYVSDDRTALELDN